MNDGTCKVRSRGGLLLPSASVFSCSLFALHARSTSPGRSPASRGRRTAKPGARSAHIHVNTVARVGARGKESARQPDGVVSTKDLTGAVVALAARRAFSSGGGRTDLWRRETGRSVFWSFFCPAAIFWVCLNSDLKKEHQHARLVSLFMVPSQEQAQSCRRRVALREIQTARNAA